MNIGLFTRLNDFKIISILANQYRLAFNQLSIPNDVYAEFIKKLCKKIRNNIRITKLKYSIFPFIISILSIGLIIILAIFNYVSEVSSFEIMFSTSPWYPNNIIFTILKYILISIVFAIFVFLIIYNYYTRFLILSFILFIILIIKMPSFTLKLLICIIIFIFITIVGLLFASKLNRRRKIKYLSFNKIDLNKEYQAYLNLVNTYNTQGIQQ